MRASLQQVGGLFHHICHPLTAKFHAMPIDIQKDNIRCLSKAALTAMVPATIGAICFSAKVIAFSKERAIGLAVGGLGIFYVTYLCLTLACKLKAVEPYLAKEAIAAAAKKAKESK